MGFAVWGDLCGRWVGRGLWLGGCVVVGRWGLRCGSIRAGVWGARKHPSRVASFETGSRKRSSRGASLETGARKRCDTLRSSLLLASLALGAFGFGGAERFRVTVGAFGFGGGQKRALEASWWDRGGRGGVLESSWGVFAVENAFRALRGVGLQGDQPFRRLRVV